MEHGGALSPEMRSSPLEWRDWTYPDTTRDSGPRFLNGAMVQAWSGSAAAMNQPPLDHHLIVLHQGGPKRVTRRRLRDAHSVNVAINSCTTVEAGSSYQWTTEGPIAFAHVYVDPARFSQLMDDVYTRGPVPAGFGETIGLQDGFVTQAFLALADDRTDEAAWAMVADHYLDAMLVRLAALMTYGASPQSPRVALTQSTVRRVRDYVAAHLADPISLDDMARVAGYSRYHFVRAFRQATGLSPYGYVIDQRLTTAQQMLVATDDPIGAVAVACGLSTHAQFSKKFRGCYGITPGEYRRLVRGD